MVTIEIYKSPTPGVHIETAVAHTVKSLGDVFLRR